MKRDFSLYEARVIGVLLEKEVTTPDQYPLSLNALTNAVNQKSNRSPVLELSEAVVKKTLEVLGQKGLVKEVSRGGRVEKFQHRFCNTEFGDLKLNPQELAIICELLLRGPQTVGELKARASRMTGFDDAKTVEDMLLRLQKHLDGPLVAPLAKEPGRREVRYAHCFSVDVEPLPTATEGAAELSAEKAQIQQLQQRVEELEAQVAQLRARLRQLGEAV